MYIRRSRSYKLFRETPKKFLSLTTALVMVATSLGGALPALISNHASAQGLFSTQLRLSSAAPSPIEAGTGVTTFSAKEVISGFSGWTDVDTGSESATLSASVTNGQVSTDGVVWGSNATVTIPAGFKTVEGSFHYRSTTTGTHAVNLSENVPYPLLHRTLHDTASVPVTVNDTTAPSVPTGGQPSGSTYKTNNAFNYTWSPSTDNSDGHVTYEYQASQTMTGGVLTGSIWNSTANGSASQKAALEAGPSIPSEGTGDGTWYWQVRAIDASGNTSAWSQIWSYTLDSQAPNLVVTSPVPNAYERDSFDVTATASDSDGLNAYYVAVDGTGKGYAYRPANGTMPTVTIDTTGLNEGSHILLVRTTDLAGNPAQVSQTFTVDRTRPTITFTSPSDFNSATYNKYFASGPNLSIQATDTSGITSSVLHVYNSDGSAAKFCSASTTATTSCDISTLPAGDYYVKAGATDGAGNNQTVTKYFTIDKTKPTVAFTAPTPADNIYLNDNFTVGFTAHDNTQLKSVNVSLYDNSDSSHLWQWKTTCYQNDTLTAADLTDSCVLHLPAGLSDGAYVLKVGAQDAAGNWSVNTERTIHIDRTGPTITVKSGYVGDLASKTFSNVSFKLYDANKVDKYDINGHVSDFTNNNYSDANFQNIKAHLVQGANMLKLYDVAGNSTTYTFTFDNVAPTATIDSAIPKAYYNGATQISIHAIDANYSKTDLYRVGEATPFKTYTGDYFGLFWLADGNYRMVVSDAAGNSTEYSFAIDKAAPVVAITAPSDGDTLHGTVTVSGMVTDANPDHYYFVVKDSHGTVVAGPGIVNQSNVASWNWDTTKVADGTYTIDLEARDAAGNKDANSVRAITVKVDNTAPVITVNTLSTTDTTPTITGTVDDSTTPVVITVNGHDYTALVSTTANTQGTYDWTANVADTLSIGTYDIVATATDTVGNVGQDTTANELTITAIPTPPVTPILATAALTFAPQRSSSPSSSNSAPAPTQAVLGDSTTTPSTDGKVKGASTVKLETSSNKKNSDFLLLGWWWFAVLAAVAAFWLFVARRRKANQN